MIDPTAQPDPVDSIAAVPRDADPAQIATDVHDDGDASLLRLIDRLAGLLERSDLTELEVEAGDTALVLRKPAALGPVVTTSAAIPAVPGQPATPGTANIPAEASSASVESASPASVKAPLTGIFYASPSPGSPPYVHVGGEVAVGQIIGLIEAMKLFNEIKSDIAGRVVRIVAESGQLVKAKQPLIEVQPL